MREKILIDVESPKAGRVSINLEANYQKNYCSLIIRSDMKEVLDMSQLALEVWLRDVFPMWKNKTTIIGFKGVNESV
jgi:hypothetical protein